MPSKKRNLKNVRLSSDIVPDRYKLIIRPDFDSFLFAGEEIAYLELKKSAREVTFHARDLKIFEASYRAGIKKINAKISYNKKDETVTFRFGQPLPKGRGELGIKFEGILNDLMRGFYRSRYAHEGKDRHIATTQFEATDARRAFPCIDEPAAKAAFDVTLMIPAHMTAISNTIPSTVTEHDAGYKVVQFAPTPKMSTYLLAFIVGEFEYVEGKSRDGVLVRVFVTPGKKHQAVFALEVAKKTITFFNNYFGIRYPLPVLDLIAIPDFEAGAMENWGAVTYRESALLVDPDHSSAHTKQWVALVIAHELAHQWFGNLVTMEWWTHLWLNEGFASYIEYLAVDHIFPEWDIWTQFVALDHGRALELDSLMSTHPVEVDVGHPSEIDEIFDAVSYSKGASLIRMLADYLGPSKFRAGLCFYLKKHSYGNASTDDLWAALGHVSGKPIGRIMRAWTKEPGYPVVSISRHGGEFEFKQERFLSSPLPILKEKKIWPIPVRFLSGKKKSDYILMSQKTLRLAAPKKGWFKLNPGETAFYRSDYGETPLSDFKTAIESRALAPEDRLGIERDVFALAESGRLKTYNALALALSYKNENDYTVWSNLASNAAHIKALIYDENFLAQYESFGRELYSKIAARLGWNPRRGERHTDELLRPLVIAQHGGFGDRETIDHARKLFASGKQIHPNLRGAVYVLVAKNGGSEEYEKIRRLYAEASIQEEKNRLGKALASFTERELLKKTLRFALSKNVRSQDKVGMVASVWANPRGKYLAWKFFKENRDFFYERYDRGHMMARLIDTAGVFNERKMAQEIVAFFGKYPIPNAARSVRQAVEKIESNHSWLTRDRAGMAKWLERYR